MGDKGTLTKEGDVARRDQYRKGIALAVFFLLPLAVIATAPTSCAIAGGGDRCWSLAGLGALAYPLWLVYCLPTGLAVWRDVSWRRVAAINILAGWTVMGWFMALKDAAEATQTRSRVGEPSARSGWAPSSGEPPTPVYRLSHEGLVLAEAEQPPYQAVAVEEPAGTETPLIASPWAGLSGAPAWVREGNWPASSLLVKLCGGFEAYSDGRRISDELRGKQAVSFLWLFLCLRFFITPGSQPRREEFADEMSPGLDGRSQRRQLSNRLHDLSQVDAALSRCIRADTQTVSFDGELAAGDGAFVVDLLLLHELAERGRRDTRYEAAEVAEVERLLESCGPEVLPEWDLLNERIARRRGSGGELIAAVRGRQADDLASVTLALAQTQLEGGFAGRAADLLRSVLELKPDREDVARRLVAALTAAGRLSEAEAIRGEYLH
jgi:hypothetical protein